MTKVELRNAWFQVHKWIGILLALILIPLSITGSMLVWDDALDRIVRPSHYAAAGPARLPPPPMSRQRAARFPRAARS